MASKGLIKRVRQLQQKKYRTQTNQFVVEGSRAITEFIKNKDAFDCVHLLTTKEPEVVVMDNVMDNVVDVGPRYQSVTPSEMSKMTGLSTACDSLAVFQRKLPDETAEEVRQNFRDSQLSLALDSVRDPGNLGTLIRLCDWFGMRNLLLSSDCCDCYNPKVVRATSGSLARVRVRYADCLGSELRSLRVPLVGASMEGQSVYDLELPLRLKDGETAPDGAGGLVLVMGSEGQGLSNEVESALHGLVSIPSYPFEGGDVLDGDNEAESLNVAMAAGILISEMKRRLWEQR